MRRHLRWLNSLAALCFVFLSNLQLGCTKPPLIQEDEKEVKPATNQPVLALPRSTPISQKAIDLIIYYEISDHNYYNSKLSHPTWPGGASGTTWAIGYDGGYYSKRVILLDWRKLREDWRTDLSETSGITGIKAKTIAQSLHFISIDWNLANEVFSQTTIPQYYALALRTFPGLDQLCPDAQGSLTSLVYNRGSSLIGPSRIEMRNIRDLVPKKDYRGIVANLRAMGRLWEGQGLDGLIDRRNAEADLVLSCVKEKP